jgi:hypothetical protein
MTVRARSGAPRPCTGNSRVFVLSWTEVYSEHRNMAPPNATDASVASELPGEPPLASQSTKAQTSPPPESHQSIWLRRAAIISFWAVAVLLGLPVWWTTTAIYRAELPLQDMTDWAEGKVRRARARRTIPLPYPC